MNRLIETVILGVIQGLTEWLPVSSTGHLKIAEKIFGLNVPMLFDVALHLGTLAVILSFFRSDVKKVFSALRRLDFKTDYGRLIPLIVVGSVPTALIGLAFGMFLENVLQEVLTVAVSLIACGFVLYSVKAREWADGNLNLKTAFLIGAAQGIAVIPGLSRSGLTIAAALLLGVKRDKAFKFSFLLSVPAIIGAFGLTLHTHFDELAASNVGLFETFAGMVAAMVVGYLALKLLWRTLEKGRFHVFAFYCWILGAFLIMAYCLNVF
ncbi:MAG: undecaprenyl-diphosphate phosphatase [Nitrososphaerota archaeon]|nr:undecaprenyl-diphosphate phosphatase [Candidatus Bathyarchaeota archaeon]MDW8022999.1 undecaprenyl-diphosphate phosphatase [Nitrososphaerota archaeon]